MPLSVAPGDFLHGKGAGLAKPAGSFAKAESLDRQSQKDYLESRNLKQVGLRRALRLLALPVALLVIGAGYLLIWSIGPDTPLEEVLTRSRLGVLLTILGGALFALWLYRSTK